MVESLSRQRVLNFLDVFYAGDTEGALAHVSDDVEFFSNAPIDILPHMGHHAGKDAVRAMWQTVHKRYSSMRYDVPIIVAESDKVAANIRVFFRKATNNRIVQFDIAAFYALREGRITHIREIMDTFDLVQQVHSRTIPAPLKTRKSTDILIFGDSSKTWWVAKERRLASSRSLTDCSCPVSGMAAWVLLIQAVDVP